MRLATTGLWVDCVHGLTLSAAVCADVVLTPSRRWPGKGLLGVTIRFDSYEGAEDQLLHVMVRIRGLLMYAISTADGFDCLAWKHSTSRQHHQPLSQACKLRQTTCWAHQSDYCAMQRIFTTFCWTRSRTRSSATCTSKCLVICQVLRIHLTPSTRSTVTDQVRIVSIAPSEQWGGDGVLGAEVAHGVLHRLPGDCRETNGSSVGYVSLSKDAIAATDPFCKCAPLYRSREGGRERES